MHSSKASQNLFSSVADCCPESMHQALRVAFLFERDLLQNANTCSESVSIQSIFDGYHVSRGVGLEAIRILQHREIIQSKRGPNGGLQVIAQSDCSLKKSVMWFLAQKGFTGVRLSQARESVLFVMSCLSPGNPVRDLLVLMLEVLEQLEGKYDNVGESGSALRGNLRADQIAWEIVQGVIAPNSGSTGLTRIGHEDELCEQFHVSKPVIRQAIRILESQSMVETRRGRGGGLYFSSPQLGPVSRILALWLLGRGVTFTQLFELEHPLRVSIALLATRSNISGTDHQQLQQLQENMESNKQVQLIDIITMEKRVSRLADNDMLGLLLKSMTVYKIGRAEYQEIIPDQPRTYATLNRQFLRGLFSRQENRIEYFCQQKNQFLQSTDLRSMHASPPALFMNKETAALRSH